MRARNVALLLALFACISENPVAANDIEIPTHLRLLPLSGDTGEQLLTGGCRPTDYREFKNPSKITCDFTGLIFRTKVKPLEITNKLKELETALSTLQLSELKNRLGSCERLTEYRNQVAEDAINPDSKYAQDTNNQLNLMEALCASNSAEEARKLTLEFGREELESNKTECTVFASTYSWEFELKRFDGDSYQWRAQVEPISDACGIVTIATISPHNDSGYLWRYEQRRIVTNPDGRDELMNVDCADRTAKPIVFSWDGRDLYLACESISW